MVPVTVERRFRNQLGSSTWWVDDVLMTELTRYNKKVPPPDDDAWNKQIFIVRVFDSAIW
ncbi:MAG: hypothetical protein HY235_27845 [Acidobacteria bacterium]|nr:hypothetical protein [Acidobacteriota bacterium]